MRSIISLVIGLAHLALSSKVTAVVHGATRIPSWTTKSRPTVHARDCFQKTTGNRDTEASHPGRAGGSKVDINPQDPNTDPVDDFDFQYSAFFDFRNVVVAEGPTPWSPAWSTRTWFRSATDAAPLQLSYLPSEAYITNNNASRLQARQNGDSEEPATYLTLRTQRLDQSTQAAAGLDYIDNVTTISMSMLARVHGSSGAVAGFFTYYNDTTESDIEVLTRDGNSQVRVSNQPTADPATGVPIPDASFNVSLARRSTTNWNVYRLDLLEDKSNWYVDGDLVASTTVNVPEGVGSTVTLNSGAMAVGSRGGDGC